MVMKFKNPKFVETYVTIGGIEYLVAVEYDHSPPEPHVNFGGDIEVISAWHEKNGDLISVLSDDEYEQLKIRVWDYLNDYHEGMLEDYAEAKREAMMEDRYGL